MTEEVGRELKVSELVPQTVVVLEKPTSAFAATLWVVEVLATCVVFTSGELRMDFVARRTGPDWERITDDSGVTMHIYEYLGEV